MPFDDIHAPTMISGLADTAYADLTAAFAGYGHNPSTQQWAAIRDLLDHLEHAANGTLSTALHVSTIPAGAGKSQSIAAFARALLADPTRTETAILILVNRIEEGEGYGYGDLCQRRQLPRQALHIYVGPHRERSWGARGSQ